MATVWERFSQFVKKSEDLEFYAENRVPALGEAAQYMKIVREKSQITPAISLGNPLIRAESAVEGDVHRDMAEPEISTNDSPATVTPDRARLRAGLPRIDLTENGVFSNLENPTTPHWLADEDTLRDEGVLFGLSESEPTDKTDSIHTYFQHLTIHHERDIEQQNERVQELNLYMGQKKNRIEELKTKLEALKNARPEGEHQLPRTVVGLVLSVAMCVGNYYLIEEALRPAFTSSSIVALGVFLAGMFNLFGRISLFHDTAIAVSWRRILEEVGMPLAAALFVFAQASQTQNGWQAAALFVFVFFLFLFVGKLLLSNITVLRNDLRVWLTAQRRRREAVGHSSAWEEEIVRLDQEIDDLRVKKWQVLREQSTSESARARLYARRDMLIKLFESEFYLARTMKERLSGKQLREIRGE